MLKEEILARKLVLVMVDKDATFFIEDWRKKPDGVGRKELLHAITALVRAVREDEREVMQDPKSWPDWKRAFAEDVYGVPPGTMTRNGEL